MMIDIEKEFDKFFEFPTDDKSHVSSTSCKLFASHIAELERNKFGEPVAWITEDTITSFGDLKYGYIDRKDRAIPDCWQPLYAKKG
jgi:hypothetical protein